MDQDALVKVILGDPAIHAFRYLNARWWVCQDGYWELDRSTLRIDRLIFDSSRKVGWQSGLNRYMVNRVRSALSGHLYTNKLPGIIEPYSNR